MIDVISDMLSEYEDFQVVGMETDGSQAVVGALRQRPDVIIMDLSMPGCHGLTAIQLIREKLTEQRILVLTVSEKLDDLAAALRNGAQGYLLKRENIRDIVSAVRRITSGEIVISNRLVIRLISEFRRNTSFWETLPEIERRVLTLIESGLSITSVAGRLSVGENQVNSLLRLFLETVRYSLQNSPPARSARSV
jgi:DNA-binding NarL/FixJ family response regulator